MVTSWSMQALAIMVRRCALDKGMKLGDGRSPPKPAGCLGGLLYEVNSYLIFLIEGSTGHTIADGNS